MGAGLRANIGPTWGPIVWRNTIGSAPNSVLANMTNSMAKTREKDMNRKSDEKYKEKKEI